MKKKKDSRKKEYKKIKRRKNIADLFNINIEDNFIRINEKEFSVIFEVESFNIDILTSEQQNALADIFRNFYNISRVRHQIHCIQIARNYDEVELTLVQKERNSKNEYAAEIFKHNHEYIKTSLNEDIVAIKYYFKFIAKNKQEYDHILSCISNSFSIDVELRMLEKHDLLVLINQTINFDFYDDYKLGINSIENQLLGAD